MLAHGDWVPLPLARVVTRSFPAHRPYRPALAEFVRDLARATGHDPATAVPARRTTFTEMLAAVSPVLAGPEDPVGMVVLAHATADSEPTWPVCFLADRLPGDPRGFAVADQGVAAPFTALRLVATYLRAEPATTRAVLVVADQCAPLPGSAGTGYGEPAVATAVENRLVALVFDVHGALGTVGARADGGVSAAEVSRVRDSCRGDPVVTGAAPAGWSPAGRSPAGSGPDRVVPPAAGLPATGPWLTLVRRLGEWRADGTRRVVLLGYDRGSRTLGRAIVVPDHPGRRRTA